MKINLAAVRKKLRRLSGNPKIKPVRRRAEVTLGVRGHVRAFV
jgi:hypothetical protein